MSKTSHHDATIQALHDDLGIPASYASTCGLEFHPECRSLVETEADVFGRQPRMSKEAYAAWQAMKKQAMDSGIELQIVSAYRSAQYQKELLQKKMEKGEALESILKVNAAPGYSEHHSGCALDLTTPGFEPLDETFEKSEAFAWLCKHAADFGFSMSFPRDNPAGMIYEPWHWRYTPGRYSSKSAEKSYE